MPLPISGTAISEKNKLTSDSVWHIAIEVTVPGLADPIRIVDNNADVTWRGETWQAFPFELDPIPEGNKGEVPRVDLRVSNVSRAMEQYLHAYDAYIKSLGYSPITFSIFVLNSKNLASTTPEVEHIFELTQPRTDSKWATLTLGADNPFSKRFPVHRILKNHCRFHFNFPAGRDLLCGYASSGMAAIDDFTGATFEPASLPAEWSPIEGVSPLVMYLGEEGGPTAARVHASVEDEWNMAAYNAIDPGPDQFSEVVVDSHGYGGCYVRGSNEFGLYLLFFTYALTHIELWKYAEETVQLADLDAASLITEYPEITEIHTIKLEAIGTTLNVYFGGVLVWTGTDTSLSDGNFGIWATGSSYWMTVAGIISWRGGLAPEDAGSYTSCGKTLPDCRLRNNSPRFGGFLGVGATGLRLA